MADDLAIDPDPAAGALSPVWLLSNCYAGLLISRLKDRKPLTGDIGNLSHRLASSTYATLLLFAARVETPESLIR